MGVFINTFVDDSGKLDKDIMVLCAYAATSNVWTAVYMPLQAADLLANSCYNEMLRQKSSPAMPVPELYKLATYPTNFLGLFFDAALLEQVAKAWPIRYVEFSKRFLIKQNPGLANGSGAA